MPDPDTGERTSHDIEQSRRFYCGHMGCVCHTPSPWRDDEPKPKPDPPRRCGHALCACKAWHEFKQHNPCAYPDDE